MERERRFGSGGSKRLRGTSEGSKEKLEAADREKGNELPPRRANCEGVAADNRT